jgi:hypothetical protein
VLERSVAGGAWQPIATLEPGASGEFARELRGTATAQYRARVAASTTESGASPSIRVLVRRGIVVGGVAPGATAVGSVGRVRSTSVTLSPRGPDVVVTLAIMRFIMRFDISARRWAPYTTLRVTSVNGRAIFSWRPTAAGSYELRASTTTTALFANGLSGAQRWTIR